MGLFGWSVIGFVSGMGLLYVLGSWLLGDWPWTFWSTRLPEQYDGKGPYETWAQQMEEARRLQTEEERE